LANSRHRLDVFQSLFWHKPAHRLLCLGPCPRCYLNVAPNSEDATELLLHPPQNHLRSLLFNNSLYTPSLIPKQVVHFHASALSRWSHCSAETFMPIGASQSSHAATSPGCVSTFLSATPCPFWVPHFAVLSLGLDGPGDQECDFFCVPLGVADFTPHILICCVADV